ncbi:MAG: AGE family epimerase/isomerase [Armatimonadota bacterium]
MLSHFWTQGLLQYYCLTGDPDVLEVACALGDKIVGHLTDPVMRPCFWGYSRELGWPALALAHLADITGDPRYTKQFEEILDFFMHYDYKPDFARSLVPGLWSMSCLFEGADLYQRRTGDAQVKAWLIDITGKLCQATLELHREGAPLTMMIPMVMSIGYEHTGDEQFLQAGMLCVEELMDTSFWPTPSNETKPMAVYYRGLIRFLHHAQQAGLLDRLEYFTLQQHAAKR